MVQIAEADTHTDNHTNTQKWKRPSHPELKYSFNEVVDKIQEFTSVLSYANAPVKYRIYIGSDSQRSGSRYNMVTAIGVTRTDENGIGRGSIYFHTSELHSHLHNLKLKLSTEAWLTLSTFSDVKEALDRRGVIIPIELHFDVNPYGPSRIALSDVTGMAKGSGCDSWKVKPEAWCASTIADRHSK